MRHGGGYVYSIIHEAMHAKLLPSEVCELTNETTDF